MLYDNIVSCLYKLGEFRKQNRLSINCALIRVGLRFNLCGFIFGQTNLVPRPHSLTRKRVTVEHFLGCAE